MVTEEKKSSEKWETRPFFLTMTSYETMKLLRLFNIEFHY